MDHATLAPALLDWVAALTGVTRLCCQWENDPRVQHNGQLVLLRWVSEVAVGVDAPRWDYAADPDPLAEMTPTVEGNRQLALQVDIEVHDQRAATNAHAIASRARTRVYWPSLLAQLRAVGLAVARVEQVQVTDYAVDGRMVSRRSFDVVLNAVSAETDTAGATSYIATVTTVGTVTRPDGGAIDPDIAPGGLAP